MLERSGASAPRMSRLERREQLLDVTAAMIARDGFRGVSILAVARAAGITRPIVYEHFGDLDGLLQAVVARETSRARVQVEESTLADLDAGDPLELMLSSLRIYLTAVREHPDTWTLVLMPPDGAPATLRQSILRGRGAVLEKLTRAVRPGLTPGDLTPDPELTARTLSAIADEYARLVLTDPERFSIERLLSQAGWFMGQISNRPGSGASLADRAARVRWP